MNSKAKWIGAPMILAVGAIGLAFTVKMSAQIQSSTTETAGEATQQVQVERAVVLSVSGNDVFVRMEDGTIRHIANVPESARATVDGKEIGIHDVKPGMRLEKTITTTTVPKIVKTTQTVTGKVFYVNPPNRVILTMENNENQSFNIPKGQKFMVNGQMTDAFGLKKGQVVTATKIVEQPVTEVEQQAMVTGKMPPPPPPPPANVPILVLIAEPAPAPAQQPVQEASVSELPTTGSDMWLIGLFGLLLIAGSGGIRLAQRVRIKMWR